MRITERERKYLVEACFAAIRHEEGFIEAYRNVDDGSEKEPVANSLKWIRRWRKIMVKLESFESVKRDAS